MCSKLQAKEVAKIVTLELLALKTNTRQLINRNIVSCPKNTHPVTSLRAFAVEGIASCVYSTEKHRLYSNHWWSLAAMSVRNPSEGAEG